MKDNKDKIVKILKSNLYYGTIGNFKDCANKIEQLYRDYYPKEFIEWFTSETSPVAILYGKQKERFASTEKDYSIDELYTYWKTQIKDK